MVENIGNTNSAKRLTFINILPVVSREYNKRIQSVYHPYNILPYSLLTPRKARQACLQLLLTFLWLAGNEGMEKKMETTIMGYIGTTIRIHSFLHF